MSEELKPCPLLDRIKERRAAWASRQTIKPICEACPNRTDALELALTAEREANAELRERVAELERQLADVQGQAAAGFECAAELVAAKARVKELEGALGEAANALGGIGSELVGTASESVGDSADEHEALAKQALAAKTQQDSLNEQQERRTDGDSETDHQHAG